VLISFREISYGLKREETWAPRRAALAHTFFGFDAGPRFPTVADGYSILLRPLSRGQHTVSFSVDFDLDGSPDLGADYTLLIVDKHDYDSGDD